MGADQGKLYQDGKSCFEKGEFPQALTHFTAAGEHADSLFMLGEIYNNGNGVAVNKEHAVEYYLRSHNLGHSEPSRRLGQYYAIDKEPRDYKESFKYYSMAHERKANSATAIMLGTMLYTGTGIEVDYKRAYYYLNYANEEKNDNCDMKYLLGILNLEGKGVEKNEDLGIKLLVESYSAGNYNASYKLGHVLLYHDYLKEKIA